MSSNEQISTTLLIVAEHLKDLVKTQQKIATLQDKHDLLRRLSEIKECLSSDDRRLTKEAKSELIRLVKNKVNELLSSIEYAAVTVLFAATGGLTP